MYEGHFKLTSAQDTGGYLLWPFMNELSRKQDLCKSVLQEPPQYGAVDVFSKSRKSFNIIIEMYP